MPQRTIRSILTLFALALVSTTITLAQSSTSSETPAIPTRNNWQIAQSVSPSKGKLFVVTVDQPDRKQTCHIQSFTIDKLVCFRAIGGPRTYLPQQIVALILPGDGALRLRSVLGLNVALGATILGTIAIMATCPVCAAATGIAALLLFGAGGAVLIGDYQPNRLLYLAPGQQLSGKLGFVQS
jgi:hypothetical protein